MAVIVHVDEEQQREIIDALKPFNVDIHVEAATEGETANFFLSRISSKLDNVGQLRWLHRIDLALREIKFLLTENVRREEKRTFELESFKRVLVEKMLAKAEISATPSQMQALIQMPMDDIINAIKVLR